MNDLIDLKRPVSLGTPVPLWKCRFSTFWKKASNLGCSSPLRHFNNQSAIQPDGNVDWRMAWLEVIIHLEWANKPGYQAPSGGCREKKNIFSEVQNKNLHEPCVPPCCPLMLNGLCSYENQTGHPEAAGAIVKSDCFLCILSLHVKYDVLEQNWPSAAPAVAQDVRSQSFVFNSGVKMWKDADFQFCWDLTILNVFFLAQSRL